MDVHVHQVLQPYEIHARQGIIPGLRFLCLAHEGRVRLNKREFTRFRWVDICPVPKLDWIGGVKEVLDTVSPEMLAPMMQYISTEAVAQHQIPASTPEKRRPGFAANPSRTKAS